MRTRTPRRLPTILLFLGILAGTLGAEAGTAQPAGAIPPPADDTFYAPPAGFETKAPGTILRTRGVVVTGLGIPLPVKATQMLVRSTDAKGRPIATVSTLLEPLTLYFGKRPLLSYQPATDSLGDQCEPSYLMRLGLEKEEPLMALGLLKGWAVVVTDYQGPRHAYGPGRLEGQTTLDGIRAAERLSGTGLAGTATPVGMMGYSGGALATGWAAELQPTYAPELNVKGVAAGGTPSDLKAAGQTIDGGPFSGLFLGAAVGLSREYEEILPLLNDKGREMVGLIGDLCYAEMSAFFPFRHLSEFTTVADPLNHPTVAGILAHNKMGQAAPKAPVYLYHSQFDELIPVATARELKSNWCARGAKVTLNTDYLSEHVVLAATGAPAAISYLNHRFLGLPAPNDC